jgi:hypothetical protein
MSSPESPQALAEHAKHLLKESHVMAKLAAGGGFAVDPAAAHQLAQAFDEMHSEMFGIEITLYTRAGQVSKLGSSPYAVEVAAYQHEAAQAFKEAMAALKAVATQCAEAYRYAGANYAGTDDEARQTIGNVE